MTGMLLGLKSQYEYCYIFLIHCNQFLQRGQYKPCLHTKTPAQRTGVEILLVVDYLFMGLQAA